MRKSLSLLFLVCFLTCSIPSIVFAKQEFSIDPKEKSFLEYNDFIGTCLTKSIHAAIRKEYNITYGQSSSFEQKFEYNTIRHGSGHEHGGYIIAVYVKPGNVEHLDRLTFHVTPEWLQDGVGTQLLKYERSVRGFSNPAR